MKRGLAGFWYRFKNWYFRKEPGPGEPLTFLCGSEEELRKVTLWMCHSLPSWEGGTFDIFVNYWTEASKKGNTVTASLTVGLQFERQPTNDEMRWLSLISQYNMFMGTVWKYSGVTLLPIRKFVEMPAQIQIKVSPPSAHERAESLLSLSEWLNGKVSEEEKRELLGLCD